MAFKSYSQNLKKSYQVVFEKKLKITTTTRTRVLRRGHSYSGGAAKKKMMAKHNKGNESVSSFEFWHYCDITYPCFGSFSP